jgi:N utilization substance protein B
MKARTRARGAALQVLFEVDMVGHPPLLALEHRLEEEQFPDELADFIRQIVSGVFPLSERLDQVIARYAPEWPFDQIAAIDRNILRIATWEFAVQRDTPVKVAINEAVELAKTYGSESTSRFVNGVLGSLVEHENEIMQYLRVKTTDGKG